MVFFTVLPIIFVLHFLVLDNVGTCLRRGGERYEKLEGSDHAPVYVQLKTQPPLDQHDVPPLAARFMPELRGRQQSIGKISN